MKHWQYLKYMIRHKWYVTVECFKMGLYWRGLVHDLSKFLPSEWKPYLDYFYGDYGVKNNCPAKWLDKKCCEVKQKYDEAWLFHQHRNRHHWQYWLLRLDEGGERALDIPDHYLKEMAADWIGASKAIRGKDAKAWDWYEHVQDKTILSPETKRKFELLLRGECY